MNGVGIKSSSKKELSVSSQSCQCDPYYTREEGSQHPIVSSIGIQSCSDDSTSHPEKLVSIQTDIDLVRLNAFLKKGEKVTQREIRKSIKNNDDWKHINRIHGTSTMDARCLHKIYSDHLFNQLDHEDAMKKRDKKKKKDLGGHHPSPEGRRNEDECKMDEAIPSNKYIISCLTWNCTSSMIGVSYEVNVDHSQSWCSHDSFFCLWNLFRNLDHDSKPSISLTIDGCITCCSAHPHLATIYSIGTRSGKVFVVNSRFFSTASRQANKSTSCQESFFSSSGNYTRSSNPASVHHSDSVTSTHWIPGTRRDNQQLVSIGMDGRIFVWLMDGSSLEEGGEEDTKDLVLSRAFVILVESLGLRPNVVRVSSNAQQIRGSKSSSSSSPAFISSPGERRGSVITKGSASSSSSKTERSSSSPSELGIISSCFSREDPYSFLVGCVGGSLFLCSLDSQSDQNKNPSLHLYNAQEEIGTNISYNSPVRVTYVSHRNNVNSVEFCTTSRNLFVSGSMDGEVRVYNLLDVKPLAVLHVESGLRSVSWSVQAHETRYSSSSLGVTKSGERKRSNGSSEFETFLYCLLQNGLLASFHFSLVSSSSSHPSSSSASPSLALFDENNKLHPVAEFPLPRNDPLSQGITYFSFNHFGKEEKLISIATGRGVVSIWQLL